MKKFEVLLSNSSTIRVTEANEDDAIECAYEVMGNSFDEDGIRIVSVTEVL